MNFINENDESKSGKIVVGYIQDDNSIYASEEVAGHDELFDLYSFTPSPGIYKNSWRFNKEKKILFFWDLPEEDKIERVKSYLKRKNYTVNSVESLRDYTGDDFKLAMYLSHGDAYDDYPKPIKPAKLKSYTFDPNEPSIAEYTDYYTHLNEIAFAHQDQAIDSRYSEIYADIQKKMDSREAKHVKPDGTVELVKPKTGKTFSLKELQQYVDGYIDIKKIGKWYMVINAEGKLHNLPYNSLGTSLYKRYYNRNDPIVGNILICRPSQID